MGSEMCIRDRWTTDDRISTISTTDPAVGGDDDIVVGDGSDIVLGGVGSDAIDADRLTGQSVGVETGDDIVIGDNGFAEFFTNDDNQTVRQISTTDAEHGDRDLINTSNGSDIVLGGSGGDLIDAGTDQSDDVVVGDNGIANFTETGKLTDIATTDPATGGDDDITVGDGSDVVLGGVGSDAIDADRLTGASLITESGDDIVIGDNGDVLFNADAAGRVVTRIRTTDPDQGDRDIINTSNGSDIVFGGSGGDTIDAGLSNHGDIVVGDNGIANFTAAGELADIATTVPATGGDDDITVGDGDDIVLGGVGSDAIDVDRATGALIPGDTGDDVVVGDNGRATFFTGDDQQTLTRIETTDPTIGDRDLINTNSGNDVVIGGAGGDLIDAGTTNEQDIVIGDNGLAEFTDTGRLSRIATTDTDIGGDDDITVGDGDDVVSVSYTHLTLPTIYSV